ncbi:MAG: hypothetical protein MRERV_13c008 [Mycoplasmataceae bacterium RV_VA103A]|nr:MAG: hypothetical protein MRERV_13c008 [Mycoplasmataceae bacterium RV_VA103A]
MPNLPEFYQWLQSNPTPGLDWQQFAGDTERDISPGILINKGDYLLNNNWELIKLGIPEGKGDTDEDSVIEVIKQYHQEREREKYEIPRERVLPEGTETTIMLNPRQEFKNWLNQDPSRKQNLPSWEKFIAALPTEKCGFRGIGTVNIDCLIGLALKWQKEDGNLSSYFSVLMDWIDESQTGQSILIVGEAFNRFLNRVAETAQELEQIKQAKEELETQLQQQASTLNQLKEKLEQETNELAWQTLNLEACQILSNFLAQAFKNSENITKRGEELKQKIREGKNSNPHILEEQVEEIKTFLYQEIDNITSFVLEKEGSEGKLKELEGQLASLVVSSGLLSQQVNELTSQLSEKEQELEQKRLESEIKSNLIREQNDKINQQTNQLTNYQNLLRMAEENLKKGQEIIQQKEGQLERLEKEKNLIGEELELTGGRIKELEGALRGADAKIAELEARIKELESKGDNSEQLERLKKELAAEKQKSQQARTKSQSEIKRLQNELQQTKKREEELAAKIKELGTKKVKVQEVVEKSFWETVKTPLFYGVGIVIVVIGLGWIWSKLEE